MKYNKIALIGMMGSGKSTASKLLAQHLNYPLFELDEIFEKEQNIKIKDYFKKFGEDSFRKIESEILKKSIDNKEFILSCGGGIILKEENRKVLFESEIKTFYLKASSSEIYKRIKNEKNRPLLLVDNPKKEIEKILNSREQFYTLANEIIITDNKTPQEITEEILEKLWKK